MRAIIISGLILILFTYCSGQSKINQRAIELNNKAVEYLQFGQPTTEQIDSAIYFLDMATEIEEDYFIAYTNKIIFLNMNKDYSRLLETNKELQRLRPNQPMWIIQEGLFQELSGDSLLAFDLYNKGLIMYDSIIRNDTTIGFDFEFEYIGSLILGNKPELAKKIFNELNSKYPNNEILKHFVLESKKELLLKITGANNSHTQEGNKANQSTMEYLESNEVK